MKYTNWVERAAWPTRGLVVTTTTGIAQTDSKKYGENTESREGSDGLKWLYFLNCTIDFIRFPSKCPHRFHAPKKCRYIAYKKLMNFLV
ncbi:MAG: hypothetical protein ACK4FF_07170 [Limnobacter sp.]|uniref:hypothetical protein n=1 Tax=Limnobacter sp. TaxID=2003368 RepID=UPI00391C7422